MTDMTKRCQIGKTADGLPCGRPATFRAYWIQTAEDEVLSCAQHLAKAVWQVRAGRLSSEVVKVQELPG